MRVLITGGTGFIGHHLVEYLIDKTKHNIVILDRLDTTSTQHRLDHIFKKLNSQSSPSKKNRIEFVFHDLRASLDNFYLKEKIGEIDIIYHLAASSHVDRSISDPLSFVQDNVVGTCNLLNFAREHLNPKVKIVYFSTDEVFGPAKAFKNFKENDCYNSCNPYAATKAGAEELCLAFANTYGMDIKIIHCMNVIGERQHPEKFIPMCISKILADEEIKVHARIDEKGQPGESGSRFYIHAKNVCHAVQFILQKGKSREKYNIVGEREVTNLSIVKLIAKQLKIRPKFQLIDFHSSRPGHDLRYALDGAKLQKLGWTPPKTFEQSLAQTVDWFINNKKWLKH